MALGFIFARCARTFIYIDIAQRATPSGIAIASEIIDLVDTNTIHTALLGLAVIYVVLALRPIKPLGTDTLFLPRP